MPLRVLRGMEKPCEYCIEETCKGAHNCDCGSCDKRDICPRVIRPIIRITTCCTQACTHCCFSCSPKADAFMSLEVAEATRDFLVAHRIKFISIMGGEVFCHPQWREILSTLLPVVDYCRIVSNGDWASREPAFATFLAEYPHVKVSLSRDQWHTNAHVDAAVALLKTADVLYDIGQGDTEDSIVPVGRGELFYGVYACFNTYCSNPEKKYSFLVDEQGTIFKCGFGVWDYASVQEYREGGFFARFKKFNQTFYGCFIGNCAICERCYRQEMRENPERRG